jgi:hypothetical protein
VQAYPNPASQYFSLLTRSSANKPLHLTVTDAGGRVVESRGNINPNGTITLGHVYRPGVYYAQLVQGSRKVVVKLVKSSD